MVQVCAQHLLMMISAVRDNLSLLTGRLDLSISLIQLSSMVQEVLAVLRPGVRAVVCCIEHSHTCAHPLQKSVKLTHVCGQITSACTDHVARSASLHRAAQALTCSFASVWCCNESFKKQLYSVPPLRSTMQLQDKVRWSAYCLIYCEKAIVSASCCSVQVRDKVSVSMEVPDDALVYCDPERLKHVMHIVLANAIKYTKKGKIQVQTHLYITPVSGISMQALTPASMSWSCASVLVHAVLGRARGTMLGVAEV